MPSPTKQWAVATAHWNIEDVVQAHRLRGRPRTQVVDLLIIFLYPWTFTGWNMPITPWSVPPQVCPPLHGWGGILVSPVSISGEGGSSSTSSLPMSQCLVAQVAPLSQGASSVPQVSYQACILQSSLPYGWNPPPYGGQLWGLLSQPDSGCPLSGLKLPVPGWLGGLWAGGQILGPPEIHFGWRASARLLLCPPPISLGGCQEASHLRGGGFGNPRHSCLQSSHLSQCEKAWSDHSLPDCSQC